MNCLEYRRLVQAAPHHLSSLAQAHVESCPSCQAWTAQLRQMDEALLRELQSVAVPDGLAERILLQNSEQQRPVWRGWALAAGMLLGVALTVLTLQLRGNTGLAGAALAHVEEEPMALTKHQQVSRAQLATALASVGAQLKGDIGEVTYLDTCPMPGGKGQHIVVSSPYGRYSLILMPEASKGRKQAKDGMHAAIAKPTKRGTYAVVGSATPDLQKIERMLDQNIRW